VAIVLANWAAKYLYERKPMPLYAIVTIFIIGLLLPIAGFTALKLEIATHALAPLAICIGILPIGLLALLFSIKKIKFEKNILPVIFLYALFNCLFIDVLYPIIYKNNPVTLSLPLIDTSRKIVAFQDYNPAYNFYLPHNVEVIQKIDSLKILSSNQNCIVLTRKDRMHLLDSANYKTLIIAHDIFENPTSVVIILNK
jgi:hypothetical protein